MKFLPQLTEDEVRYICSVIPLEESVYYFKQFPKDFAKVMPGFRATSMKNQTQVNTLLYRFRNQPFIASFIEKHISRWIEEIQGCITQRIDDGDSKEAALLQTLPNCFFSDNVGLFFTLVNEVYSEEYIALLSAAVRVIKDSEGKREKLDNEIKCKATEINKLQRKFENVQLELDRTGTKFNECSSEIKDLKCINASLKKMCVAIQSNEEAIAVLKSNTQVREEVIHRLRKELTEIKNDKKRIEAQIRVELEKEQSVTVAKQEAAIKPKCPINMDEFKDYLGYNLENLGVPTHSQYFAILKEHLCGILFQGVPVIINRGVGVGLMKCIANALVSTSNVRTLAFSKDLSTQDIEKFLSIDARVVCLDNFIGNFNETELLPLFECHRDKIVFLTVAYDRTLYYISEEFFRYCHYLNLNRIEALLGNAELTEDPSTVEEKESNPQNVSPDTRYSPLFREMLREFGFRRSLVEHKCISVSSEKDLCRALAFDILPYCLDVMQITPYNTSERLIKYSGDAGRCPYKNLFKRWFAG